MPTTGSTTPTAKTPGIEYTVGVLETDTAKRIDQTGYSVTALLTVAWGDRTEFEEHMLGYTDNSDSGLVRVLPERHPENDNLYCTGLDLVQYIGYDGTNDGDDWPTFQKAVYRATYTVPQFVVSEDEDTAAEYERYVQWVTKSTSQYQSIPGGALKFPDGTPLDKTPIKVGRYNEMNATWIQIPYANSEFLDDLMGRINTSSLTWNGRTYLAETVLFDSWEHQPKIDSRGERQFDYNYKLRVLADGRSWNTIWRLNSSNELVYDTPEDDAGNKMYQLADLNALFGS